MYFAKYALGVSIAVRSFHTNGNLCDAQGVAFRSEKANLASSNSFPGSSCVIAAITKSAFSEMWSLKARPLSVSVILK